MNNTMINSANTFSEQCQEEQCFLDRLVTLISFHNVNIFGITFTNFPHSLLVIPH